MLHTPCVPLFANRLDLGAARRAGPLRCCARGRSKGPAPRAGLVGGPPPGRRAQAGPHAALQGSVLR